MPGGDGDATLSGGAAVTGKAAASVHQRLLNRAKETNRPFNELLQYFALERFLYRLGNSPYSGSFRAQGSIDVHRLAGDICPIHP